MNSHKKISRALPWGATLLVVLATAAIRLNLKWLGYLVFIGLFLPAIYFTLNVTLLVTE